MLGMMAIRWSPAGPIDPANSLPDQAIAADFRELRDGTGFWSFLHFAALPYATIGGGQRRDWLIDIHDGSGRLLRDRLRAPIEGAAFHGPELAALAKSFEDIPWTPWVGEQYPFVSEGFYRELGAFLSICVKHDLAISFLRG